jgi:hypothetical protein
MSLRCTTKRDEINGWVFQIKLDGAMLDGGAGYRSRQAAQCAGRKLKAQIAVDLDPDISQAAA